MGDSIEINKVTEEVSQSLDELSDIISEAFDIRSDSDYDDYYIVSKEEVQIQIDNAKNFYNKIEKYFIDKQKDHEKC